MDYPLPVVIDAAAEALADFDEPTKNLPPRQTANTLLRTYLTAGKSEQSISYSGRRKNLPRKTTSSGRCFPRTKALLTGLLPT
jgi:hypothetical protein